TTSVDPEVDTQSAVTDPFAPPGDFADIAPIQKAAGGPQWAFVGVSNNQQTLQGIFLSGTTASGTFPNCLNATVPRWVITITRDGNPFATAAASNVWFNIDFASPPHCGYSFTISRGSNYEVLTPGTYQFHMQQNSTDVTASLTVRACTAPI